MASGLTKNKVLSQLLTANLLLIASDLMIIFLKRASLPEKLPLFYSRPWGEEQLAHKDFLFLIPLVSLVILVLNYYLSLFLIKKSEKFLAFINVSFALLFSALGAITLWKIILTIT